MTQEKCKHNDTFCINEECPHKDIACMGYVIKSPLGYQRKYLPSGCIASDDAHKKCAYHKCVLYQPTAIQFKKKNEYYCCCYGDLCNRNLVEDDKWIKSEANSTATTSVTPKENHSSSSSHMVVYIVLPIVLLGTLFLVYLIKFHKRTKLIKEPLLVELTEVPLESETKAVQVLEVIHEGRISCVYKASYQNKVVAVKMLHADNKFMWDMERDTYEKHQLNHENILKFIGAEKRSLSSMTQFWIITEYHNKGSLIDFLQTSTVDVAQLFAMLLGVVTGLNYLHRGDLSTGRSIIAHRDLKTRNIMVKNDLTCCIGDFGLAIPLSNTSPTDGATAQVGTIRYMAPEILQGAITFQRESYLAIDIYALALVMWEVLSRCRTADVTPVEYEAPYVNEVGYQPLLKDMCICVVSEKRRPVIKGEWRRDYKMDDVCSTIEDCWDDDPDARLTVSCVKERLTRLSRDNEYPTYIGRKSSLVKEPDCFECTESTGL